MALIPKAAIGHVGQGVSRARLQGTEGVQRTAEDFGAQTGADIERFAKASQQAAIVLLDRTNKHMVTDASNKYRTAARDINLKYQKLRGQDAIGSAQKAEIDLAKAKEEVLKDLNTPVQLRAFSDDSEGVTRSTMGQLKSHQGREEYAFGKQVWSGKNFNIIQTAKVDALGDDPGMAAIQVNRGIAEIESNVIDRFAPKKPDGTVADAKDWPEGSSEIYNAEMTKAQNTYHAELLNTFAAENPARGLVYLEKNKKTMDPKLYSDFKDKMEDFANDDQVDTDVNALRSLPADKVPSAIAELPKERRNKVRAEYNVQMEEVKRAEFIGNKDKMDTVINGIDSGDMSLDDASKQARMFEDPKMRRALEASIAEKKSGIKKSFGAISYLKAGKELGAIKGGDVNALEKWYMTTAPELPFMSDAERRDLLGDWQDKHDLATGAKIPKASSESQWKKEARKEMDDQLSSITEALLDKGLINLNKANDFVANRRSMFETDIAALEANGPLERGAAMTVVTDLMRVTDTVKIGDKVVNIPDGLASQMRATDNDGDIEALPKHLKHVRSQISDALKIKKQAGDQQFSTSGESYGFDDELEVYMSPIRFAGPIYKPFGGGVKEISPEEREALSKVEADNIKSAEATKREKARVESEPGVWDDFTTWFNSTNFSLGHGRIRLR